MVVRMPEGGMLQSRLAYVGPAYSDPEDGPTLAVLSSPCPFDNGISFVLMAGGYYALCSAQVLACIPCHVMSCLSPTDQAMPVVATIPTL